MGIPGGRHVGDFGEGTLPAPEEGKGKRLTQAPCLGGQRRDTHKRCVCFRGLEGTKPLLRYARLLRRTDRGLITVIKLPLFALSLRPA
jgi:hypothetical protein